MNNGMAKVFAECGFTVKLWTVYLRSIEERRQKHLLIIADSACLRFAH